MNHDQNRQTSVKNVQHLAGLFLSKQIVNLIALLERKILKKFLKFNLVFCLLLLFAQGFEQRLLKDAEISSLKLWILLTHVQYAMTQNTYSLFMTLSEICMAFETCMIRYHSAVFVWVIFISVKIFLVKQKKMFTFDRRPHSTGYVISNF